MKSHVLADRARIETMEFVTPEKVPEAALHKGIPKDYPDEGGLPESLFVSLTIVLTTENYTGEAEILVYFDKFVLIKHQLVLVLLFTVNILLMKSRAFCNTIN